MPQPVRPLEHQDAERKSDETLQQEASVRLGGAPALQLVAELLNKLRALDLPWWTPEFLRSRWTATERMRWYRSRPDLRQNITSALTGLAPKAARKKAPDFQASLIDSVLDEGDASIRAFEESFDPCDLVVYGPVDAFWGLFMERMPWGQDIPAHQQLCAWLIDALLTDNSTIEGLSRRPILTPWEARTSIDGRVWHTRMPLEVRVAIDEARFQRERDRPGEPFHTDMDLSIAASATITAHIPLRDVVSVFVTAERVMGFPPSPRPHPEPGRSPPEASSPHRPSAPPAAARADAAPKAEAPVEVRPAARQSSPPSPPAPIVDRSSALPPAPAARVATLAGQGAPPVTPAPPVSPASPASPVSPVSSAQPLSAQSTPLVQRSTAGRSSDYPPASGGPPPGSHRGEYMPALQGGQGPFQGVPSGASAAGPASQDRAPSSHQLETTLPFDRAPGSSVLEARLPIDRPLSSSGVLESTSVDRVASVRFEPPVLERPKGSGKLEPPGEAQQPASPGDRPPSPGKLSSIEMLLEELGDMPSEDDRTNPWDITGDEPVDEATGATMPARRESAESAKRRRSGKL